MSAFIFVSRSDEGSVLCSRKPADQFHSQAVACNLFQATSLIIGICKQINDGRKAVLKGFILENMALMEKYLVVKDSTLPNAGRGLFTTRFIPKGTRIVEYKGRVSSWKDAAHNDGNNGYLYYINRNFVIDAKPYKKALGRFANDARGLERLNGTKNNCEYVEDGKRVFIEARRDIPAGSEIFVDYGKEYWEIIRYNQRLERMAV